MANESVPLPDPIAYGIDLASSQPYPQPNAANSALDNAPPGAIPSSSNYSNPDGHELGGAAPSPSMPNLGVIRPGNAGDAASK